MKMPNDSSYTIPVGTIRLEQEIKRSRFIATLGFADSRKTAAAFIDSVRSTYPDAAHNCWAYVAGNPRSPCNAGMSDGGEPRGTAGKPMLNVLRCSKVGDIAAVVTRYFGGIKLGTGGLARAYSGSVRMALNKIPLKKHVELTSVRLAVHYQHENAVRYVLDTMNLDITDVAYSDLVSFDVEIPVQSAGKFLEQIERKTGGNVRILNVR